MHLLLLTQGANAPNAALTLNRVALGAFFAISGYHKLFNASRHATLTRTLLDDGVHDVPFMRWLLPAGEFVGGAALVVGLLAVVAAFGLFLISAGAVALDAVKRIRAWQPLDRADWLGDLLYSPEALYCIGLTVVMLAGPGPWSLDAIVATFFAG
jgi:putative oxidoreductase